jgi:hypothetical protein
MFDRVIRGVTALLLAGVLLAAPPVASGRPPNLLVNPGFEEDDASQADLPFVTGWSLFNEPQLSWVTQQPPGGHEGLQSLKLYGPWNLWGGVGASQMLPASEGETWQAEVWAINSSEDPMGLGNVCFLKIEFRDANGDPADPTNVPPDPPQWLAGINVFEILVLDENTELDVWNLYGLGTAPAPAETASATIVLVEVQGDDGSDPWTPSGGSAFLDDAYFASAMDPCDFTYDPVFDFNNDQLVNSDDYNAFEACATGPGVELGETAPSYCTCMDVNDDNSIDQQDFGVFQRCFTGDTGTADPACDD